ncbi:MAG: hypothetical protein EXR93_01155 [Gemmatimonadetes bacterium]|nr:hypothetical protein [Gemmatimonadota bacterium]
MTRLVWWLRVVGVFYLLQFAVMVFVKVPIRTTGPAGTLELAASGDALARFVVDTWVIFGLEVGAVGVGLLVASRMPHQARALVWTIIAIEVGRGLIADAYSIARGNDVTVPAVWVVLHSIVIVTGLWVLRGSRGATATA